MLAGLLAAAALAGYLLPEKGEAVPRRVLLRNAGGAVVLPHAAHAEAYGVPCQDCHHESPEKRTKVQRCKSCHGVTFDAAFAQRHQAFFGDDNAACATCHHYELTAKKWGHDKHATELGLSCADCHHKDAAIEPEPQNCADCHESGAPSGRKAEPGTPPNLADAVHARCMTCHEDLFQAGEKGCAACHTLRSVRENLPKTGRVKLNPLYADCAVCHGKGAQKLILGSMDAYHKNCMGCHEKLGTGPYGKKSCSQCHTGK